VSGTIFVGVDGSPASVAALRWAVAEAELRDARVVAIHAWTFVPPAPIAEPGMIPMPGMDYTGQLDAERAAAEAELEAAIVSAFPDGPPVEIESRLAEDDAAEALVAESDSAELVVVGSSGRTGLKSVLLGSVSRHVVQHARCPVVVVKEKATA
jgi:nucleotide-binding universal stress UspA family protein